MTSDDTHHADSPVSAVRRSWRLVVVSVLVAISVTGLVWVLVPRSTPVPQETFLDPENLLQEDHSPDDDFIAGALEVVNPGYVGPEVCASCHEERVNEFQATGHYRACREPDPDTMPPGFEPGSGTFLTRHAGLRFEMGRSGDEFTQTAIQETSQGRRQTTRRIDLIYGAGTADEIYFAWHDDDRMYELPMAWLYTHDQWASEYYDPYGSGDFSRPLTLRCLECHNTWFEYVPGSINQYRREDFILGVTCERCHGPGQEHVDYHQQHPHLTRGHAIVNPASLPQERRIEVCTQCHSNAMKHLGPALSYRPGEPLADHYKTLISKRSDEDHVANQIQYLRESGCFQKSESMSCITCHDPHRRKDGTNSGSVTCFQCHTHDDCGEQPALVSELRDRCVDCHMPARIKINVNFQTQDDVFKAVIRRHEHRIAVDHVARDEVLAEWLGQQPGADNAVQAGKLRAGIVDHWVNTADQQRRQHRHFAAIGSLREALQVEDSPRVRRLLDDAIDTQSRIYADWDLAIHQISKNEHQAAITTLTRLLEAQPHHAPARGKLGTMYAVTGQAELAVQHLQQVAEADPNDPYGHAMLGWLAYLDGRHQAALGHYAQAEQIEPYSAKLMHQIGLALIGLKRLPEALESFHSSFLIDPGNPANCQSLALALQGQGRHTSAVNVTVKNVHLADSEKLNLLMTLAETCAKSKQFSEAIRAIDHALEIAKAIAPELQPEITRRRYYFKARARQ